MKLAEYDSLVIGGGFFGCTLAAFIAREGERVLLCEKGADLMQRASFVNQARVHHGYHYPRSILTALRSKVNFSRFAHEYGSCIVDSFEKYYAVARNFSNVSARQFRRFVDRMGAPISSAPARIAKLFNQHLIEEVFAVTEFAFDSNELKALVEAQMHAAGVEICLNTWVKRVSPMSDGRIRAETQTLEGARTVTAERVFNCTYSQINELLTASGLARIKLKHELTELAMIKVPEVLERIGVTVMCGPFFSVMPFPPRGLHSLSHVRYTPHSSWLDAEDDYANAHAIFEQAPKRSRFQHMMNDARRYLPVLSESVYVDSLWEVKTVLPQSETDDSRPILFNKDHGIPGLYCVMGAKIDNVFDAISECVDDSARELSPQNFP